MQAGSGTYGPNQMWTHINISPTKSMRQYLFEAPIDERHTRVFLVTYRNIVFFKGGLLSKLNNWLDRKVTVRNLFVASQDITVVKQLQPVLTPPSTARELMMPADRIIAQYREKLVDYFSRARGGARCRQPAPARRQSAAHPGQQEPGDAGGDRGRAADRRPPRRGLARALRGPAGSGAGRTALRSR